MMKNKMMYGKQIKRWISVFLTVIMFFTTTVADYLTGGQCTVLAQEKTATGMKTAGENTSRMDLYAKAEELQTPLAIYNFVRNNINYEYYGDMRKGAQATYDSLAGNDVDIACLLSTMLNAAGYETRYVSGTIRVDQRLAEKMTGTADVRIAADILALSGYHVVVVRDGAGNAVCLEIPHTWVECYLPYTDYRGNGNNRGEWLWVPLDAGIKNYEDTDSIYAHAEEMGTTESSVTAFISEHPELYVVKRKIKQENLCYLPLSLPYETVGETNRSTEYSGATDCIIFTLGAGSSIRLSSPELYNKRLTLVYEECDGMVRPELMLEGKMIAAGSLMEKGENHIFTMTVQSGKRKNVIENTLRAGSMYAIITDMQSITSKELEKARMELLGRSASVSEKNIYTEEYLGVLLDYAGKMYFAQVDIADRMIAEEMNVTQVRSLSVGMVGYSVTTELENGVITGISEGTLVTDIDLDFHMAVSDTGNAEDVKKYMLASGMMSSAYEGAIWEQITGIPSVSTVSILNEAKECGIPVLCITGENLEDALSGLSVEADVLREIRQEAASGKMVIIPKENITIGDWNGTGYIVLEPEHYTGRYMICGGIRESGSTSGGSAGVSVYLAYLVNLFMSSVDIAQSLGLVEVVLGAMELGGVIGCVLGISTYLLCVTLFVLAVEEYKANMDNLFDYQSGDEQAGQEIIVNAGVNVAVTVAFSGAGYLAKNQVAKYAEKCVADKLGTELAQTLLKDGADSRAVSQAIKAMEKAGVNDTVIRKAAKELTAEEFSRVGRLTKKGLTRELLEKAVDNKAVLEKVSDETLLLFKKSAKSADEIITVLERHGDEAGRLYELYGDEVIDIALKYGDEGLDGVRKHGSDFMVEYHAYGDEFVENYLKYGDEAVDAYVKYGADAADVLKGGSNFGGLVKEGLGKISGMEYAVTQSDIDIITKYLTEQGFIDDYANKAMLERLQSFFMKGEKITGADAVFYTHELKEAELIAFGIEQSIAHEMALQYYEVSPYSVYHPDVIRMEPEWWNNAWFEFWNIER